MLLAVDRFADQLAREPLAPLWFLHGEEPLQLMECADAVTGEKRYVIAAVGRDGGDYVFTPFGHLAAGNPYDAYLPPDPDNPDGFLPKDAGGDEG